MTFDSHYSPTGNWFVHGFIYRAKSRKFLLDAFEIALVFSLVSRTWLISCFRKQAFVQNCNKNTQISVNQDHALFYLFTWFSFFLTIHLEVKFKNCYFIQRSKDAIAKGIVHDTGTLPAICLAHNILVSGSSLYAPQSNLPFLVHIGGTSN